mmetsp:Transcript_2834/g.4137  ORF Transcript_2834/g.4137 Transcript_2834/m.4137 type:complete len:106 (+) Transcript_2834:60-377(+)
MTGYRAILAFLSPPWHQHPAQQDPIEITIVDKTPSMLDESGSQDKQNSATMSPSPWTSEIPSRRTIRSQHVSRPPPIWPSRSSFSAHRKRRKKDSSRRTAGKRSR